MLKNILYYLLGEISLKFEVGSLFSGSKQPFNKTFERNR